MLKQIGISVVVLSIGGIGTVFYTWGAWTTQTLIKVDKRTEVMASQIDYIKTEMERTYGNLKGADATASIQASIKGDD